MTRFEEMNKGILSTSDIKIYEENDSLKKKRCCSLVHLRNLSDTTQSISWSL